ncbi:hypothetical protein [Nocardia caishijiensis]|uniref:Uncharacterized protein n=1 Tax=Nocardia caishijiensis TaxID=184756 RepID=A0ABQ6YGC3_9NOCA|nr:hypothetical protein [Nocardia caishijiensis]KAF0842585.1 hypothetical protein FNL39_111166 [Nocardia caishijiensis]
MHAFTLFFDWSNGGAQVRAISENPPPGCRWYAEGSDLHCLRMGEARFDAIADIAGELRRNGLAVDFGHEKDEWDNDPDRIAHLLWARWALSAAIDATTEAEASTYRTGMWVDHDGLHYEDGGCTWWAMLRVGEGRFVLYGEDESSGVKWHKPQIDMLAGGPDWLPFDELRERAAGYELGCVYWFEDGAWARERH